MDTCLIVFTIVCCLVFLLWLTYLIIERKRIDEIYKEYDKFRREHLFLGNWWWL